MSRKMLRALPAVLAIVAGHAVARETGTAQEPPVAFPAEIEQVTVDVVIIDKETGRPVTDLTGADIEVYEDGKRQTISAFDMFEVAPPPADEARPTAEPAEAAPPVKKPAPRTRVSTNLDKNDRQGRTFMIVFDDVHTTGRNARGSQGGDGEVRQRADRRGRPGHPGGPGGRSLAERPHAGGP